MRQVRSLRHPYRDGSWAERKLGAQVAAAGQVKARPVAVALHT